MSHVRDLFELVSSVGVFVRVILHCEFSVGLLQLSLRRIRLDLNKNYPPPGLSISGWLCTSSMS